jgi:hypothetical protein
MMLESGPHFLHQAINVNWPPFAQCLPVAQLKSAESDDIAITEDIVMTFSLFKLVNAYK